MRLVRIARSIYCAWRPEIVTWYFGTRVNGVFKAIENWASQSDGRVRLLIILMWLAFGAAVLAAIVVMAIIMLPDGFWSS